MESGTLHFVGIGGIGMSAIARILLGRGERISGSDLVDSMLLDDLRAAGARVTIGHAEANVNGARALVVSSAIDPANPEYRTALACGIPIVRRGEMLAELMRGQRGIAICGTHGKTTTTAMTAAVLRGGNVDASLVLGGIAIDTNTNAHDGASPWFLTEADESDGSFALLDPAVAVVTNVENDHLASDEDLPKLARAFEAFLEKIPGNGLSVVGGDCPASAALAALPRRSRTVTFGFSPAAHVRPANVRYANLGATFDVLAGSANLGTVEIRVPGAINVANALAAITVGRELEIPFARIAHALLGFSGVRRRFEILARSERMTVVDDYAHHPTAVRATIAAARQYYGGPIVVAFQPHRYTRTEYLASAFADALRGADEVYLTPVYAASEPPIPGVNARSIGEPLRAFGTRVRYVERVDDAVEPLLRDVPAGALVLMLGAGSITRAAKDLARAVQALGTRSAAS